MSYYDGFIEQLFLNEIKNNNISVFSKNNANFFQKLQIHFPCKGSKIDWSKTNNHFSFIAQIKNDQNIEKIKFYEDMLIINSLEDVLLYSGDGEIDYVFKADKIAFKNKLAEILEIPQHHYFTSLDYKWCLCFTFEGDVDFAFSQINTSNYNKSS